MSYGDYDNTKAMMEFTEVLKNEPDKAYDFIINNSYRFSKDGLADILKEMLYSIHYHIGNSFYGNLESDILGDVQIELDDDYDDAYQKYDKWVHEPV